MTNRIACAALLVCALAFSQTTSSRISGSVTDPQGSAVPAATVTILNPVTGQTFSTVTSAQGEYVVPSVPPATYRITVEAKGFRTVVLNDVKVDAAVPATVNARLEVGSVSETVEVSAAAEVVQSTSATVSSTLVGRQLSELPVSTRNLLDLVLTQPGTQTPGTPRTSSLNGLPKGTVNISIDGLNVQDNLLRSDDGFFTTVMPRTDAIEEVTVSTAGAGAESAGEGAAQIKFVTKSGTNAYHGGGVWQNRNTFFNSNYYFNTIDRLPRDVINLNQTGVNLGGPFKKNRAFFFVNYEDFRLPQTYRVTATVPNPEVAQGIFTYQDSATRQLRQVNLFDLARSKNATLPSSIRPYPTTIDPMVQDILNSYGKLATPSTGSLQDRITSNNDYNRKDFTFQTPGKNNREFLTTHFDYNITSKHHFDSVWNYQKYVANPDGVNSIYPLLPGTGTVLGHPEVGGTRRISFSIVGTVRSTLSANLTNEARYGVAPGGNSIFREEISPALFSQWRGYVPTLNYVTSPFRASSQSRRNTPVTTFTDNLTWSKSSHLLNIGGTYTRIKSWQQNVGGSIFSTVNFANATTDPVNNGTTSLFDLTNFPNSSATNRSDAASMYAMLVGRVSSVGRSVTIDENTLNYAHAASVDRNHMKEMALYVQDSWRATPSLTLNYGVRWDVQFPLVNENGTYTRVGLDGLYGVSGVGNLFKPGTLTGTVPQFQAVKPGTAAYNTHVKQFSPSLGFAWRIPATQTPGLSWVIGKQGHSVLRGGYSIATVREGMDFFISVWGANQGRSASLTVSPDNFPVEFGPAGSVLFRDQTLPVRAEPVKPSYPIAVNAGNSVNDFDPNLKMGYVQSWNLSFQRELARSTVIDVRYVGNHSVGLWRRVDLNEVNIFENGFLDEFKKAQSNLGIARRVQGATSTNFGNQGLPGQVALPIMTAAGISQNDTTFATNLDRGQAGTMANSISTSSSRMTSLRNAGYPANFFTVNPTTVNGGSILVMNGGSSTYNALQIELRRRMASGLLMQASYAWSKSLTNMPASSSTGTSQPSTFRSNLNDKGPSPWDIRHGFKLNYVYELPVGPGKRYFGHGNLIARKALEGWQISGVSRVQSGSPDRITSNRGTFNSAADNGVVLYNMTAADLNEAVKIRKTTASSGFGLVYFLPQDLVNNSLAAWEVGGFTLNNLNRSKPYIGPQMEPGKLAYRIWMYGPWQARFDVSLAKETRIAEGKILELRAQALNVVNSVNFLLGAAGNEVNTGGVTATFGQTRSAYRDITVSGSSDPGGRIVEFVVRFRF
ncbi:MAG TPA: TonB-dependent receptor [Candidatus Solibacter sp.]|nr:TonB-dependent receptor [Candidatus Solibacter sp.]